VKDHAGYTIKITTTNTQASSEGCPLRLCAAHSEKTNLMINKNRDWKNPFGDGKAAKRIVKIIQKKTRNL